jgi:Caspase domain
LCFAATKLARYTLTDLRGTLAMLVRIAIAVVLLLLPTVVHAQAEKRFALLIGNQGYSAKIGALKNPHADIALVGEALRSLAFRVTEVKDADYKAVDTAIKRHIQTVRREGEGTISFAIPAMEPPIRTPRSTT